MSKKTIFFIPVFLYLSLILGFILNEDSTGGARMDYNSYRNLIQSFIFDFNNTFLNYDKYGERHSPVFVILLSLRKLVLMIL